MYTKFGVTIAICLVTGQASAKDITFTLNDQDQAALASVENAMKQCIANATISRDVSVCADITTYLKGLSIRVHNVAMTMQQGENQPAASANPGPPSPPPPPVNTNPGRPPIPRITGAPQHIPNPNTPRPQPAPQPPPQVEPQPVAPGGGGAGGQGSGPAEAPGGSGEGR